MKYMQIFYLLATLYSWSFATSQSEKTQSKTQKSSLNNKHCAVTYKLQEWRRLGDNITIYCKAKYFSYMYNIPLLYKPFPYSDQFELHTKEKPLTAAQEQKFADTVCINTIQDFETALKRDEPLLLECHFLTQTPSPYFFSRENPDFETEIKAMLTPCIPLNALAKPPSVVTVALHVRKGGGFDRPLASQQEYCLQEEPTKGIYLRKNNPAGSCIDIWPIRWPAGPIYIEMVRQLTAKKNNFSDYIWPVKFPPDQYYIDQLKELAKMLPGKNLLVYLFTDDPAPEKIMARYSEQLKDYPRIIFSFRNEGNHHSKNVLEDLFAIAQCDCLISANSSFASAAQLLGNHSIFMFPIYAITMPDKIVINKVGVISIQNSSDFTTRKLSYNEIVRKIK